MHVYYWKKYNYFSSNDTEKAGPHTGSVMFSCRGIWIYPKSFGADTCEDNVFFFISCVDMKTIASFAM